MPVSVDHRRELAEFLRTRRERIAPDEVGLPRASRRRTPGLRREEVALLAGISATWYTYVEQGRDVRVSESVLGSLARVLNLNPYERAHLFVLAGYAAPDDAESAAEKADPPLLQLLDQVEPSPAYIVGAHSDLLGWNRSAAALFRGFDELPEERRNLLWWAFAMPEAHEILVDWEREARGLLARQRAAAARQPDDPRRTAVVEAVFAVDPQARDWWSRHDVQASRSGTKSLRHPRLGVLTLNHTVLIPAESAEQRLVVYSATPGSREASVLPLLAAGGSES
jgi:transcriptional regulator with XRE-family HTH domain